MNYKNLKIEEFLEKLSSTESMPGGGTVAALVGANAVSCALKVCNLSLGKEKYKEHEAFIKDSITKLEESRKKFLMYMDEDAQNFKFMEEVYKMPRDTSDDKKKRKLALANACQICCAVPIKIIENAVESIDIVLKLEGKTNVSAASDLKIAGLLLRATVKCGWDNVEINEKYINNEKYKKHIADIKEIVSRIARENQGLA